MRSADPGARPGGDDSSLGRVGRRIGAAALGMAVVVPALIPGLDARLVGGNGSSSDGTGGGSRSTTTYNPITALGKQLELPTPRQLLAYTSDDPQPDYLRMTTLDKYDGNGWQASNLVADPTQAKVQEGIPAAGGDSGRHQSLTMKIAIDTLRVHWLPVPFGPSTVDVKGSWLWDPLSSTVFSTDRDTKGLRPYTVSAQRPLPDRAALAQAGTTTDPDIEARYGQALDVGTYVQQTTDAVTQGAISNYAKAVALQAWFRDPRVGFVYDLRPSTPSPQVKDPLEAFLRGQHGFCEQYATAMAVMLRAAGVPSRVAVGFTPGTRTGERTWSVSTSDAHAWPEAWFPGTGWLRFEPTPSLSRSVVPAYSVTQASTGPNGVVPPVSAAPQPSITPFKRGLTDPDTLLNRPAAGTSAARAGQGSGWPRRWVVLLVLLALLALPGLLSVVRRRRRWSAPTALTAWEQLQDDAEDIGHDWHPSQSPRVAAAGLAIGRHLTGPAAEALSRVAGAAEQARYAPGGGTARDGLREDAATLRAALLAGCATGNRLRAQLLPTSTVRWGLSVSGTAVADALDRIDDAITTAGRVLRRRARPVG